MPTSGLEEFQTRPIAGSLRRTKIANRLDSRNRCRWVKRTGGTKLRSKADLASRDSVGIAISPAVRNEGAAQAGAFEEREDFLLDWGSLFGYNRRK
jgi:hypothetical protein